MKKSLIALAVLAASGAAMAQSSVTLYGRLDVGTSSMTSTSSKGVKTKDNDLTGAQNKRTTSRLGVKGVEDLGGGLKAHFVAETGLNPTDASALFAGNTRQAYVALETGAGLIGYGTGYNAFDDVRGISASSGATPGGDSLALGTATANGGMLDARSRNTLGYQAKFGDVAVKVGLRSQKTDSSGTTTSKVQGAIGGVQYASGPLTVGAAYGTAKTEGVTAAAATLNADGTVKLTPASTSKTNVNEFAVGASYNFGMATPFLVIQQGKEKESGLKTSTVEGGAKFAFGAVKPFVSLFQSTDKFDGKSGENKYTGWQVGSNYDLSKRTYVYAVAGQDKLKNSTLKNTGYALGLVHSF